MTTRSINKPFDHQTATVTLTGRIYDRTAVYAWTGSEYNLPTSTPAGPTSGAFEKYYQAYFYLGTGSSPATPTAVGKLTAPSIMEFVATNSVTSVVYWDGSNPDIAITIATYTLPAAATLFANNYAASQGWELLTHLRGVTSSASVGVGATLTAAPQVAGFGRRHRMYTPGNDFRETYVGVHQGTKSGQGFVYQYFYENHHATSVFPLTWFNYNFTRGVHGFFYVATGDWLVIHWYKLKEQGQGALGWQLFQATDFSVSTANLSAVQTQDRGGATWYAAAPAFTNGEKVYLTNRTI